MAKNKELWYVSALVPDKNLRTVAEALRAVGAGNVEYRPYEEPITTNQSEWFVDNVKRETAIPLLRQLWAANRLPPDSFYAAAARAVKNKLIKRTAKGYAPAKAKS